MQTFQSTAEYIASQELEDVVNVSAALQKPLLIRGEPGTGKTLLATAIAQRLGAPLIPWHVKSTTQAQEGLYTYDTVQRLHDSRFGEGDVDDMERYIKLGPLGLAFESEERAVLLIDEIDKADLEFPNDLLHELDAMRFVIPETGRRSWPRTGRSCSSPRTPRRSCRTRSCAAASSTTSTSPTKR